MQNPGDTNRERRIMECEVLDGLGEGRAGRKRSMKSDN